jgi:hypothetical protein
MSVTRSAQAGGIRNQAQEPRSRRRAQWPCRQRGQRVGPVARIRGRTGPCPARRRPAYRSHASQPCRSRSSSPMLARSGRTGRRGRAGAAARRRISHVCACLPARTQWRGVNAAGRAGRLVAAGIADGTPSGPSCICPVQGAPARVHLKSALAGRRKRARADLTQEALGAWSAGRRSTTQIIMVTS